MLNTYTISFFGHRHIENPIAVECKLETLISSLLCEKEYIEFLVGRDGDFDLLVSAVIHRCQKNIRADNNSHIWVLPYETAEFKNNAKDYYCYYNEIEICEMASRTHYKNAFTQRNRHMIDRSDFVVFYVDSNIGGAFQAMRYAKKHNVPFTNVAGTEE